MDKSLNVWMSTGNQIFPLAENNCQTYTSIINIVVTKAFDETWNEAASLKMGLILPKGTVSDSK